MIADLSVNHVERFALLAGFTVDRFVHDYGLDLLLVTYDENGEVEPGQVSLQVKATDSPRFLADGATVAGPIGWADLDCWLKERAPIILVLSDASQDVAYWVYVQAHVLGEPNRSSREDTGTATIRLPLANRLDVAAMRQFAHFRDRVQDQTRDRSPMPTSIFCSVAMASQHGQ